MPARFTVLLCVALLCSSALSQSSADRIKQIRLDSGEIILASEGLREPRSLGSIILQVYLPENPNFPYDNYVAGLIRSREGALENLLAADLDEDGTNEIVLVYRSAGSGGYLSADGFKFTSGELTLLGAVSSLESEADPVQALIQQILQ